MFGIVALFKKYSQYDECILSVYILLTTHGPWSHRARGLGYLNTSKIRVSAIRRLLLRQMFTRFRENVSAIKLSAI